MVQTVQTPLMETKKIKERFTGAECTKEQIKFY